MCRHEAAEALGALGDKESLDLLRAMRDDEEEVVVVKETCDIAVNRIEWEHSYHKKSERLRDRYVHTLARAVDVNFLQRSRNLLTIDIAILPQ